jgi:perosamine synthetase
VQGTDPTELANMLGYNFRMGEIEAAIASVQLAKLEGRVASRQRAASQLDQGLRGLAGLQTPLVRGGNTHVYYVYGMALDTELLGVARQDIIAALQAEGVPALMAGYQNVHLLPLFRHKIAYGTQGFPWRSPYCSRDVAYGPGTCPVAEELHSRSFLGMALCMHEYQPDDVQKVIDAFHKVWNQMDSLRSRQR